LHYNSSTRNAHGIADCKENMGRHSSRRIPKLGFTKTRGIGWHVNYRDPMNGVPRSSNQRHPVSVETVPTLESRHVR
jgi:hypothetical protein